MIRIAVLVALVLAAVLGGSILPSSSQSAEAAEAVHFDPGNIISDANFFDSGSLGSQEVQQFLDAQVASCQAGYTCLKDYEQATPTMAASPYCQMYVGSSRDRASDILAKVAQSCGISPKVLLVLLQKEQSLVTHRSPSASRYTNATGFACPDTAPCDPAYSGFFYQVYYAARQFQVYTHHPTNWNYLAGRVNLILYHPNSHCGRGEVFVANQATANLYIYTPYQPNPAALANLYGTGDHCSSYGNRNFWRIYSDWFGSPTEAPSLFRTATNPAVYLVSQGVRHRVPDLATLAVLSSLGQVRYVPQEYLDRIPLAHPVNRIIRDPAGKVYFIDAGVKFPFASCGQVVDYGGSCEATGYVQLTQEQAATFRAGPALTSVVGTREGGRYFVRDQSRAEILDEASQVEAGIDLPMTVMSENALSPIRLIEPIIRDGAFAKNRTHGGYSYIGSGLRYDLPAGAESAVGASSRAQGGLSAASLGFIDLAPIPFTGYVSSDGLVHVLSAQGRLGFAQDGPLPTGDAIPVPAGLLATYSDAGVVGHGTLLKSPERPTVYVATHDQIRPLDSWGSLLAINPGGVTAIMTISQSVVDMLPIGPPTIRSGSLVRTPDSVTVYVINGLQDKLPLTNFEHASEAGFGDLSYLPQSRLDAYPTGPTLGFGVSCEGEDYVSAGGQLHLIPDEVKELYPFTFAELDPLMCAQLRYGEPAGNLIRVPAGQIYLLVDGSKHQIMSMEDLWVIAPGIRWLDVSPLLAASIPSGPNAAP